MHIFLMTRGIKREVDGFIEWLTNQQLPFNYREKPEDALKQYLLQIRVSPVQFWDISFPREHKDLMLTTLFGETCDGKPYHKNMEKYFSILRMVLGAEKKPEKWNTENRLPRKPSDTEMICVGIKDDEVKKQITEIEQI